MRWLVATDCDRKGWRSAQPGAASVERRLIHSLVAGGQILRRVLQRASDAVMA
jgi:hypothetical protein